MRAGGKTIKQTEEERRGGKQSPVMSNPPVSSQKHSSFVRRAVKPLQHEDLQLTARPRLHSPPLTDGTNDCFCFTDKELMNCSRSGQ